MEQKRREERSMCADLLQVRWKTESGALRSEYTTLEDISPMGACIQVEEPIAPGTLVTLIYPSGKFRGRAKYCLAQGQIYLVGIAFSRGSRWSRSQYKPSHLLQFKLSAVRKT